MARFILGTVLLSLTISVYSARITEQSGLRFANSYGSHMVLQRAPDSAVVWGYADTEGQNITLTMDEIVYNTNAFTDPTGSVVWRVSLDPEEKPGPFMITVSSGNEVVKIDDVLFGDVWFCSGQSNMVHLLSRIDDPDPELDDAVNYPEVRPFRGGLNIADDPLYDTPNPPMTWSVPNRNVVTSFSAVCWLFGKHLHQTLKRPIGLIQSAWGGTRIQAWMSPDALDNCPTTSDSQSDQNTEHVLWNAMVHPFLNMTIKGAIWYQGEANRREPDLYECMLPSMIKDWRDTWHTTSGMQNPQFPFGVVQLAPWNENPSVSYFPGLRWAQTGGYGYTPNPTLEDVFLAVAADLPDFNSPWGSIHPRYKRQIAKRLALGAYQVAYGITDQGRFQGPFPTEFVQGTNGITIIFDDENVVLDHRANSGFEVCCSENSCTSDSDWTSVDIVSHDLSSGRVTISDPCTLTRGIRYLWEDSPCPLEQCALYSKENDLPVPPFILLE